MNQTELLSNSPAATCASGRPAPSLPRLGFGAASLGNLYAEMSDEAACETVDAALEQGLGYFDTAPHYGFGLSEARLGRALAGRRAVAVSTKVGRRLVPTKPDAPRERHGFVGAAPFEPVFDYSYDGVMRSYEESLARLGREHIDVLLAHDLGRVTHGDAHPGHFKTFVEGGYRAMRELRDSGAVGAIGLGVNECEVCEEALAYCDFDAFLLAGRYTLLEQTALDSFLPLCVERGVSIILGGPFNSGILAEGVQPGRVAHYNYAPAPPEIVERVVRLQAVCEAHATPLAAAALQFPLAHPSVVSVIPGMASPAQVTMACDLMSFRIPDALWADLRAEGLLHEAAPTHGASTAARP